MLQFISKRLFSFIGRRPLYIEPKTVQVAFEPRTEFRINDRVHKTRIIADVKVTGPLGTLSFPIHQGLSAKFTAGKQDGEVRLNFERDEDFYNMVTKNQQKFINSMWGTTTAHMSNMIAGVTQGHVVPIKLVGVGYKAILEEGKIILRVGLSHNVVIPLEEGIKCSIPTPNKIILSGIDLKQITGFAAKIRRVRPPEPYSGKGIYVSDEQIKRKEGKTSK